MSIILSSTQKTQRRWCWTFGDWVTRLHCLYIVCRNYSGCLLQVSEYPPGWPLPWPLPCWPYVISSTAKAAFLYTDCGCQSENNVFILFGCTGEYHQVEDVGGIRQSSAQSKSKLQRLVYSTGLKVTGRTEKLLLQAIYGQTVLRQGFFFFAGPATHPSLWVQALTFWQKVQSPKMQTEQLQIFICTHLKILNGSWGRRRRAIC